MLSHVRLYDPGTVVFQAPPSTEFSRQESWSGLPSPTPGDLPDPEAELTSPASVALAGEFLSTAPRGTPGFPGAPAARGSEDTWRLLAHSCRAGSPQRGRCGGSGIGREGRLGVARPLVALSAEALLCVQLFRSGSW